MNKSTLLVILLTASIGCGVFAWRQHRELVELRAALMDRDEWRRKAGELETRNREQRAQLAAHSTAGREAAISASSSRPKRESTDGTNAVSAGSSASVEKQTAAIRELMNQPEVQAMLGVQKRAAIEQRYNDLFKKLNLPPKKIEKLKALLEERSNTMQDMIAAARDQGINLRTNPEGRKLVTDTQNQLSESIKATIGDDGFAKLSSYERTTPQRTVVGDLEQRLSYISAPLTPIQAEQLVQILAANPVPRTAAPAPASGASGASPAASGALVRNAMTAVPGVSMLMGAADDTGRSAIPNYLISQPALAQAQAILSPQQLASLQNLQQQQQTQQQLKNLVIDTLVTTQPPPIPPRPNGGG